MAILNPVVTSVGAVVCTNPIHAVIVTAIVKLVRLEERDGSYVYEGGGVRNPPP